MNDTSPGLQDILTEAFPEATADQIEAASWRLMAHAATQVADAEKRGAEKATAETIMGGQRYAVVWALRRAAEDWRRNGLTWDDPDEETNTDLRVARSLDQRADRIQAGGDR